MGGACAGREIPLLLTSIYLFRCVETPVRSGLFLALQPRAARPGGSTRETSSGGEFGWGGTSVKQ